MTSNALKWVIGFVLMEQFSFTRGMIKVPIPVKTSAEFVLYIPDIDFPSVKEDVDYNQDTSSNISLTSNKPSLWTGCSRKCGGGLQKMRKWEIKGGTNGGSRGFNLPHPIRTCNKEPCGKMEQTNFEIRHDN